MSETLWTVTHKGDVRCRRLADDHYTRQTPGHPMWTRPGYNFVLYFANAHGEAVWCWWRPKWEDGRPGTQRKDGLRCLECTMFRNVRFDADAVQSSVLVEHAVNALQLPQAARELQFRAGGIDPRSCLLITGVVVGENRSPPFAPRAARPVLPRSWLGGLPEKGRSPEPRRRVALLQRQTRGMTTAPSRGLPNG